VIELLTTYIREVKVEYGEGDPPADLAVAFWIIGRVSAKGQEQDQ